MNLNTNHMNQHAPEAMPLLKMVEVFKTRNDVHHVFGVIIYTEANPFLIKVLRDPHFWKALDKISGERWPVFAIRPYRGRRRRLPENDRPLTTIGLLVAITNWDEPSKNRWVEPSQNEHLLKEFGLDDTEALPLLLVFTELPSGEILQMQCPFAEGESEANCFVALKTVIQTVADAISQVTKENLGNSEEIFHLMKNALGQHMFLKKAKKVVSFAEWVKSLFS